ncbi:histidine kinase N-terminal 7TM domain-containing protein [Vibrio vulnificus]|uniref:histidine kinase N-terminal 7TM domain-containing diguanylate cyclase n=1 Tax=Vibrio vulnificus TaxID=672 RepID=UPI00376DEE92
MWTELTIFSWFLLLCSALSLLLAIAALRIRYQPVTIWFVAQLLAYAIEAFGYAFELTSKDLDTANFWLDIEFIGAAFIPTFVLLFAYAYKNRTSPPLWLIVTLNTFSILVLIGQLTNSYHHTGFTFTELEHINGLSVVTYELGVLYWIYAVYIQVAVIASILMFFQCLVSAHPALRPQIVMILSGITLTWLNYLWTLSGTTPFGLDLSAFGFIFCVVTFSISVFRYNFIKIAPIAREHIFYGVEHGYIVIDEEERVVDFNPAAQRFLPDIDAKIIGKSIETLPIIGANWPTIDRVMKLDNGVYLRFEQNPIGKTPELTLGRVITIQDVTEREEMLTHISTLANTDELTGCFNRQAITQTLPQTIVAARTEQRPLSLVVIDVIGFKTVNAIHGYTIGDMRLKQLANLLSAIMPVNAVLTRYVSDLFIIVLPDTSFEQAQELEQEIIRQARSRLALSLHSACLQHRPEESMKQVLDRLLSHKRKNKVQDCVEQTSA